VFLWRSLRTEDDKAFADDVTVLRRGRDVCSSAVSAISVPELAEAMIGSAYHQKTSLGPRVTTKSVESGLVIDGMTVVGDLGLPAVRDVSLSVCKGEIVGIAGVAGNDQRELVEALMGQRSRSGSIKIEGSDFKGSRSEITRLGVYGLPQEPLKNASVAGLSLAENMALRNFDQAPLCKGIFVDRGAINDQATDFVARFRVKTAGINAMMSSLSGGNVQRAVLARELTNNVRILIASNPTFGLDLVACEETLSRILEIRNLGAAVLLISEDLDELMGLVDRILVMSEGKFVYDVEMENAEKHVLGHYMAGAGECKRREHSNR
jgi:general nucleoside transport system ATP-binding protein